MGRASDGANDGGELADPLSQELLDRDIDALAERFGSGARADEVHRARTDFDERRGKVFDDDELFPLHMKLFLGWYCLDRPLDGVGRAPVLERLRQGDLDAAAHARHVAMACGLRGLFEVERRLEDGVLLVDLLRESSWQVDCPAGAGLDPGEIFEGRLLPDGERVRFGSVLLFHPRVAYKHVHPLLQRWRAAGVGLEALDRLAQMRLRFARFRNIDVKHIYKHQPGS